MKMRGCYTLALPELSAWRAISPSAQRRRAAGYYSRFAAGNDAELMRQGRH